MKSQKRTLILCQCDSSMKFEASMSKEAVAADNVLSTDHLCTKNIELAEKALHSNNHVIIACQQQEALFENLQDEIKNEKSFTPVLTTIDIRDRAGWTADKSAYAKQAALLSEINLESPLTQVKEISSEGVCLILGKDETALYVAAKLQEELAVTVLINSEFTELTPGSAFNVCSGRLKSAKGSLGGFEITVSEYAELNPHGRGLASFGETKKEASSECDILIDLRGSNSLFPSEEKRDGYLRKDPNDKIGIEELILKAINLKGEFEKTVYINFDNTKCAHSRASRSGCSRCLELCPTNAITPNGDSVLINPNICAGCGSCSSVCPSGAASYDDPPFSFTLSRIQNLVTTFTKYDKKISPRLLFIDDEFGMELVSLCARYGKGLPSDLIPLNLSHIESISHTEILASLSLGFSEVIILKPNHGTSDALELQLEICKEVLFQTGNDNLTRVRLIDTKDPDAFEDLIYDQQHHNRMTEPVLLLGEKREVTRTAAKSLLEDSTTIKLPENSPYGEVKIDTQKCTLCLACVSLCPTNALEDNADKPELNFTEVSCIQCGICSNTCPEKAIILNPRLDLSNDALGQRTLHTEEPFECISCSRPFGVKSTVNKIVAQLENNHWMYMNAKKLDLVKMCDDCRVNAQYHEENSPFKHGERPKTRTTDDYH